MGETQVPSLGWQDPLEKGMAKYSLENSKDREDWQAAVHGVAESDMTEQLTFSLSPSYRYTDVELLD